MKRVHAVTIHHRGREMLEGCLASLLESTGVELEVVVVGNGCDEPMPDLVSSSPDVHLLELEHPCGFSEANNRGVAWAREHLGPADYYYFLNNDTVSDPAALASQVSRLEAEPRAAVVGPRLLIQWAPDHLNSLGLNVTEDGWGWDEGIGIRQSDYGELPPVREVLAVTGSALLITAEVFLEIGGWPELYEYYFEDIDICLRARSAGWQVLNDPEAVVFHQVSATMTLESERKVFLFWRNSLLLVLMHWPLRRLLGVLKLRVVDQILRRPWAESGLQRRALTGALAKLGPLLWRRIRLKVRDRSWTRLLRPIGSTPIITLPARKGDGADEAQGQGTTEPRLSLPERTWAAVDRLEARARGGRTVLVVGCAPLPFENALMHFAPSGRTWQMARPLAEAGHAVCVLAVRIPGTCDPGLPPVVQLEPDPALWSRPEHGGTQPAGDMVVYSIDEVVAALPELLEDLVDRLDPSCVVGATARASRLAARLAGERPVWVDLFGDPMAEGQARSAVYPEQEVVVAYRELMDELLARGDAFSAVSERQRLAVVGQLGLAGRLTAATLDHELVHTVPCAVMPGEPPASKAEDAIGAGEDLPDDAFVLLWSGGFNTWCDVPTLVAGVDMAMAAEPRLVLVATGGAIQGHDERTAEAWSELVARSAYRQRYLLKGCLPADEAEQWLRRADAGIVTERPSVERLLGSSARVCTWLARGLPIICTGLSELGHAVEVEGLGHTYRPGAPEDLARVILEVVAASGEKTAEPALQRARRAIERWSDTATTELLRRWVEQGGRAPDAELPQLFAPVALVRKLKASYAERETALRAAFETEVERLSGERDEAEKRYHEVRSDLGRIHQSRMWRLWMVWLGLRRAISWPLRRLRGIS